MLTKLWVKKDAFVAKAKMRITDFVKDEQGDFGVSQIAMIIVGVVIIGLIFSFVQGNLDALLGNAWGAIEDWFLILTTGGP
jgi:hypothetical protein